MDITRVARRINKYLQKHCDPGHPMWEEEVYTRIRRIIKEEVDRANGIPVTDKEKREHEEMARGTTYEVYL